MTLSCMAPGQVFWHAPHLALSTQGAKTPEKTSLSESRDQFYKRFSHPAVGRRSIHRITFSGGESTGPALIQGAPPLEDFAEPVFQMVKKTDAEKLSVAQELSDWLENTLRQKEAKVAVISRNGTDRVQQYDETGMLHTGLAVHCPQDQTWHVYNLINHIHGPEPQAGIWKSNLVDFFYEQPGNKKDALVLIPPKDIQETMWNAFQTGQYKSLYFTRDYNMVSVPHTTRSLNCTKWSLMNIIAARIRNYDPTAVLKAIQETFKPGVLEVHPVVRPFVKRQPFILQDEVPVWEPVHTVTVGSLYHSGLFSEKHFYNKRELVPKPVETPSSAMSTYAPLAAGGLILIPLLRYMVKQAFFKKMKRWIPQVLCAKC